MSVEHEVAPGTVHPHGSREHDPDMPDVPATVEEALALRLAKLNARRTATQPTEGRAAAGPDRPRRRRRHAALGSRGVTLVLSVAASAGLMWQYSRPGASQATAAAGVVTPGATTPDATSSNGSASTDTTPPGDTVVNGQAFRNKYGPVQVQVTFAADGTISDVRALVTPSRDAKSVRINDVAVPRLNSEALTAQSAAVDTVSGATYTSNDYRQSLQSAIDAAREAGVV